MQIDAIIFDFDGLILDTETPDFRSWQEMYAEFGVELPLDVWRRNIGSTDLFNPYLYLEKLLGRPIDREAVYDRRKRRDDELLAIQTILPGVLATLTEARRLGLKIGLASSSDHAWVDGYLEKLDLTERFDVVRCSDDVNGRSKPNPAVYLAAIESLQVEAHRTFALEDSPNGVKAAKAAGLFCVAIPNPMTQSLNFDQADKRLTSLAEMSLTQLIDEVLNGRK
ncbi:MAG: HAD-IA family hydrolase [Chloroflexi bacterium]|nr:HAD-IA family hydrolase [Chloroflexota bacterium]